MINVGKNNISNSKSGFTKLYKHFGVKLIKKYEIYKNLNINYILIQL